jgi:hypothetical protein
MGRAWLVRQAGRGLSRIPGPRHMNVSLLPFLCRGCHNHDKRGARQRRHLGCEWWLRREWCPGLSGTQGGHRYGPEGSAEGHQAAILPPKAASRPDQASHGAPGPGRVTTHQPAPDSQPVPPIAGVRGARLPGLASRSRSRRSRKGGKQAGPPAQWRARVAPCLAIRPWLGACQGSARAGRTWCSR